METVTVPFMMIWSWKPDVVVPFGLVSGLADVVVVAYEDFVGTNTVVFEDDVGTNTVVFEDVVGTNTVVFG